MIAGLGRPAALLVVAPHPDDETIGAHALMTRARRRGVAVHVLIVSDGAASHPNSPRWPRKRLVAERRRESQRVLRAIGVPGAAICFLDRPDGRLAAHERAIRRGMARAIHRLPRPAIALCPSLADDHPDHRAVAGAAARHPGLRWLRYPVWPAGQVLPGAKALHLTTQERLAKRRALHRYRTQAGAITDDPDGFAMTRQQIAAFSRPQEWFARA